METIAIAKAIPIYCSVCHKRVKKSRKPRAEPLVKPDYNVLIEKKIVLVSFE